MIVIKENGVVYLAETAFAATRDGQADAGRLTENMPIGRIAGTRALVGGAGEYSAPDLDRTRYLRLPFPRELTVPSLHAIIPRITDSINKIGNLRKGRIMTDLVFAKGDRAFLFIDGRSFQEVESLETFGWRNVEYRYALGLCADLPPVERIRQANRLMEKYIGAKLFPMILWDTKTLAPRLLEEVEK